MPAPASGQAQAQVWKSWVTLATVGHMVDFRGLSLMDIGADDLSQESPEPAKLCLELRCKEAFQKGKDGSVSSTSVPTTLLWALSGLGLSASSYSL